MIYLNVVLLISEILYKGQAYAVSTGLLSFLKVEMVFTFIHMYSSVLINSLNAELNPICYLLALLGAHHFLHVSRIRVKSLTLRQLMLYIWSTYS